MLLRRVFCRGAVGAAAFALALVIATSSARADDNDIVMSRLSMVQTDAMGNPTSAYGNNLLFRSMVSELGVVLAPRLLTPSNTLGFSEFQFAFDLGFTSITDTADYWRVLESSSNPTGTGVSHGSGLMKTFGIFMRKGIWFPLPSFEMGAGAVHLSGSDMWAAQGYAKFALHEGYHDLPLPSLAVRGAASRLMGLKDLDLTIASLDVSVSKLFGISGTWNLEPYAGWNLLWIIPRSEVVDATPNIDPFDTMGDNKLNFVFKDQTDIIRNRIFLGVKAEYYVFQFTLEAAFALAGKSVDDRLGTDVACTAMATTTSCDSTDQAGGQQTYTFSVGLEF